MSSWVKSFCKFIQLATARRKLSVMEAVISKAGENIFFKKEHKAFMSLILSSCVLSHGFVTTTTSVSRA